MTCARSLALASTSALLACLRMATAARPTAIEVLVHGQALEGNRLGDTPDRPVSTYLPPGYANAVDPRYPVLHLLHGLSLTHTFWFDRSLGQTADDLMGSGTIQPIIIVSPDANNASTGSCYLSSPVTVVGEASSPETWSSTSTATTAPSPAPKARHRRTFEGRLRSSRPRPRTPRDLQCRVRIDPRLHRSDRAPRRPLHITCDIRHHPPIPGGWRHPENGNRSGHPRQGGGVLAQPRQATKLR